MQKQTGKHRIYMNVGYLLTEVQLRDYFSQFGQILDVYLPHHKSGRNKGFGFTTFENELDLERVLRSSEHIIDGVEVKINRAGPRPEYNSQLEGEAGIRTSQPAALGEGPRIYVGGVPEELTEEDLSSHFGKWGAVVDIYFPGKKGQKRVNYCFVTFDSWKAAQRACNESERSICGQPLQSISIAEERLAEQRANTSAAARATLLANMLRDRRPGLSYGSLPLQGMNGLPFYSARPDLGQLPLLDGLGLDASTYGASHMHAMHAAALHQAQLNAQLASMNMGMGMGVDPASLGMTPLMGDPNHHARSVDMQDQRPMWGWTKGGRAGSSPRLQGGRQMSPGGMPYIPPATPQHTSHGMPVGLPRGQAAAQLASYLPQDQPAMDSGSHWAPSNAYGMRGDTVTPTPGVQDIASFSAPDSFAAYA